MNHSKDTDNGLRIEGTGTYKELSLSPPPFCITLGSSWKVSANQDPPILSSKTGVGGSYGLKTWWRKVKKPFWKLGTWTRQDEKCTGFLNFLQIMNTVMCCNVTVTYYNVIVVCCNLTIVAFSGEKYKNSAYAYSTPEWLGRFPVLPLLFRSTALWIAWRSRSLLLRMLYLLRFTSLSKFSGE